MVDSGYLAAIIQPSNCWQPTVDVLTHMVVNYFTNQILAQIPIVNWFSSGSQVVDAIDFMSQLQFFIMTLLSMIIAVQLVARLVLITFHIVIAPLAILCMGLPGNMGQGVAQAWFKGFLSLVFSQFLQVMCLVVGAFVLRSGVGGPQVQILFVTNNLFASLAPIGIAWLVLRIPSIMGSSVVNLTMNAGQTFGGAAMAFVGTSFAMAKEAGQAIGSSVGQTVEMAAMAA